jgi:F-type H+-transporting ATPase subunit gamma
VPSLREIKRRIKTVKNIAQVTRAMQLVAASKMKRAQEQALASRTYAEKAKEVLEHLASQPGALEHLHPLLAKRPIKSVGVLLITADRGLAGAYNGNVIRAALRKADSLEHPVSYVAVGRRGRDILTRYKHNLTAEFSDLPDRPLLVDVLPIAQVVTNDFLDGKFDELYVVYTKFINTVVQVPEVVRLLPLGVDMFASESKTEHKVAKSYIYEPEPALLLDVILPRFVESQIYQAILEALASEHSARMVAMRNATDNATELAGDLTLTYNRVRQESITKEMLDIVGGVEAQSANQRR